MLLTKGAPYYTHAFGSMGETLETALQTEFFKWFHLEETERKPEEPGEELRFRPSGEKFHDLCYLDVLAAPGEVLVRMELVVRRAYIDGRDRHFAQDLVKSFLLAVLPDACQAVLKDFLLGNKRFFRWQGSHAGLSGLPRTTASVESANGLDASNAGELAARGRGLAHRAGLR